MVPGGPVPGFVLAAETDAAFTHIDHYTNDEGGFGFVLDQSSRPPVMKFDTSSEILVLRAVPGPRGDTIFKLDNGATILRQTLIGGMTLFDSSLSTGRPVVRDKGGDALTLPGKDPSQIRARTLVIAERLSVKLNRDITFKLNWNDAPDDRIALAIMADALEIVGLALTRVAEDALGREALATHLSQVIVAPGEVAKAELKEGILVITYDGAKGVQGRLSSDALVRYLEGVL